MKKLFTILVALIVCCAVNAENTSHSPVTQITSGANAGDLDSNIAVPSGKSFTVKSGGTLDVSAGTLTLANGQINWTKLTGTPTTAAGYGIAGATTSATGAVELATTAETLAGTSTTLVPPVSAIEARTLYATAGRAVRPALIWDGTTASARAVCQLGAAGTIGTADFTAAVLLTIPASNASLRGIFGIGDGVITTNSAHTLEVMLWSDNKLRVMLRGASATDYIQMFTSNAVVTGTEYTAWLVVRRVAGVITLWLDGVQLATASPSTGGSGATFADTLGSNLLLGISSNSTYTWGGRMYCAAILNAGMTDANTLRLAQTGEWPAWARLTGSMVNRDLSYTATASSYGAADANGTSGWSGGFGAVSAEAGARTGGAGSYVVRFTVNDSGYARMNYTRVGTGLAMEPGKLYRVRFWARATVAESVTLRYYNTNSTVDQIGGDKTVSIGTDWSLIEVDTWVPTATVNRLAIAGIDQGINGWVEVDDWEVVALGTVVRHTAQAGAVTHPDDSGNNLTLYTTSGVTTFGDKPAIYQLRGELSWSGSHESKALVADQALLPATAVIESITLVADASTSGTGITVGDGDTAAYWVAATAATAGAPIYATLAQRFPASNATADLKIYVDPDSANYTGSIAVTINYTLR